MCRRNGPRCKVEQVELSTGELKGVPVNKARADARRGRPKETIESRRSKHELAPDAQEKRAWRVKNEPKVKEEGGA